MTSVLVLPKLRIDLIPKNKDAELNIYFELPSASVETVEQQATAPLENIFAQLSQVKAIESFSHQNEGQIKLTFDENSDIAMKKFEVASLIRQTYPYLTQSLSYPIVVENQQADIVDQSPLLVYAFASNISKQELKKEIVETFVKPLSTIPGIKDIKVTGLENLQLTIAFDEFKLRSYGLKLENIRSSLTHQLRVYYPGTLNQVSNGSQLFVRAYWKSPSLQAVKEIPLKVSNSTTIVKLGDVAQIFFEEQAPVRYLRINGKNSVNVSIYPQVGQNTIELSDKIKTKIVSLTSTSDKALDVQVAFDNAEFLKRELGKNFWRAGFSLAILFVATLLYYRRWSYVFILFLALASSVALTVLLVWYFKIDIHLYSLAGLTISFSIIIDTTILMLDYYSQYKNRRVILSLLGASLTTITALCLVFLLPDQEQRNLLDFTLIIAIALLASLFSALFFVPSIYTLSQKVIFQPGSSGKDEKPKNGTKRARKIVLFFQFYHASIRLMSRYRKTFLFSMILFFGTPIFLLPAKWGEHGWYNDLVGSEVYQERIRPITDVALGGFLRPFFRNALEKINYRDPEKTKLYVIGELPIGATLEQMNFILTRIEEYLGSVNGVDKYVTQIYSPQFGSIEISFSQISERGTLPYELKSKLVSQSIDWSGVNWKIFGVGHGFSNEQREDVSTYKILMKGYNYDELENQAVILSGKLRPHKRVRKVNTNDRIHYLEKPSQQYRLKLDRTKVAMAGSDPSEIFNYVQDVSKPTGSILNIVIDDVLFPIMIKEKNADDFSAWQMINGPLFPTQTKTLQLSKIADLNLRVENSAINKKDRQYLRLVSFEYHGSSRLGDQYLNEVLDEMKTEMPMGYTIEKQIARWDYGKLNSYFMLVILLMVAIFCICCILFESLRQPFFIICTIPFAFLGPFISFGLFDFYFDQGGYAAFVLLGSMVANASILIVNDFNSRLVKGKKTNVRLLKTVMNRGRTILIIAIATCCGMAPFLIEGEREVFWFAFAVGTISGLIMEMFAVFIVLPVLMYQRKSSLNQVATQNLVS